MNNHDLFQRARQLMPGGVNSPVRAFKSVGGEPFFTARAEGAYLWDVEGKRYIDYVGSWGPMIAGHNHPAVREAVDGRAEVWLDTGILSGADIVAALALGADACLVGRAYLYGLMAGGERGVQRAVDILRDGLVRTMQLLGVRSVTDLDSGHARLLPTT